MKKCKHLEERSYLREYIFQILCQFPKRCKTFKRRKEWSCLRDCSTFHSYDLFLDVVKNVNIKEWIYLKNYNKFLTHGQFSKRLKKS